MLAIINIKRFSYCCARNMSRKCEIAICQFTASDCKKRNLNIVESLVKNAATNNAKIAFLPEASDYIGKNKEEGRKMSEPLNGPLVSQYKNLAKTHKIWLSIGGFHEKIDDTTMYNTQLLIDPTGSIQGIYRKLHLFDVSLPEKNIHLRESEYCRSGTQIQPPIDTPAGKIGQLICYDLRFPEISTVLRKLGSQILTYPSAFTTTTGEAHWEVLLRARAIENQCYVVAAAQYGKHNEKRMSYGHSLVVDPWGNVIAECPKYVKGNVETDEQIALATIDLEFLDKVRTEMPVFSHRRNDIYSLSLLEPRKQIRDDEIHKFADKNIPGSTVFYISQHSYAFTNIRCVVPGHVLVASIRIAPRLRDLTQEELADLFQTAVKVSKVVESVYNANSSTICVQDGEFAGQTIPHVHVHVLPRKHGDFENNDDVYSELARHDKNGSTQRLRELSEQQKEASELRRHF